MKKLLITILFFIFILPGNIFADLEESTKKNIERSINSLYYSKIKRGVYDEEKIYNKLISRISILKEEYTTSYDIETIEYIEYYINKIFFSSCGESVISYGSCDGMGGGFEYDSVTNTCKWDSKSGCEFYSPFKDMSDCEQQCVK